MASDVFSQSTAALVSIIGNAVARLEGPPSFSTNNNVPDLVTSRPNDEQLGASPVTDSFDVSMPSSHEEHTTPGVSFDTMEDISQTDRGDDGVVVDISMWTRPASAPVSPQPTTTTTVGIRTDSLDDLLRADTPDLQDERARSDSPDDVEEIPFSNSSQTGLASTDQILLQSDHPLETITIRHDQSESPSRYLPQPISFMDGFEQLRQLPDHSYQQLKAYCQAKQTNQPDFIKTKWPPPQTILRTRTGMTSWFETESGHRLLVARYRYGQMGQLVVVQDASGTHFNSGHPAIVYHHPTRTIIQNVEGVQLTKYKWFVWTPLNDAPLNLTFNLTYVWRVMQSEQPVSSHKQTGPLTIKLKTTLPSQSAQRSSSVSLQRPPVDSMLKGQDAINAMRWLKRSAPPDDTRHPVKRSRSSTGTIDTSLLKRDYPVTKAVGAARDKATGEILLRRKGDGKLVMLQCPHCDSKDYQTQQGLGNHMRISHGVAPPNHDVMVELCGIVVDEPRRYSMTRQDLDDDDDDDDPDELAAGQVVTRSSRRRHTTNGPSALEDDHLVSQFTFKKSLHDRNPRVRSVVDVNSAEKLFANALVAGVAQKDTLMLTVAVGGQKPFHIMRDDRLDFETVMKEVRKAGAGVDVVVTVEDLTV